MVTPPRLNWDTSDNFVSIESAQAGQASSPDLTVSSLGNPPSAAIAGASFSVTDTTRNAGNATAAASTTRYRLSTDRTITNSDPLLSGSRSVPSLNKGASSTGSGTVTVPTGVSAGTYYLGACADDLTTVAESNEANNCRASTATVTISGTIGITYIYDASGRLRAVSDPKGDTAIYKYDAVGNLLSINRQNSSALGVIEFSPGMGPVGTAVTIFGTGFSSNPTQNSVNFSGVPAPVVSSTNTRIVTSVPAGASTGPIGVITPTGSATSDQLFIVDTAAPSIAGFAPTMAIPGTPVVVTGANFDPVFGNDRLKFNDRAWSWSTAASSTTVTAPVPREATSGQITVVTPSGSFKSTADFYVPPNPYQVFQVESTTRMSIGQNSLVTMANNEKVALVLFDGAVGQQIRLLLGNMTISPQVLVRIYNPDGSLLASSVVPKAGATLGPYTLLGSGTYTILIAGNVLKTIAGNGGRGYNGDNQPAVNAFLEEAHRVAFDLQGNAFIADTLNHRVRKVDTSGKISTVAGTGTPGYSGEGKAIKAQLNAPYGVAVDGQGNVLIADTNNARVRKVTPGGIISTVAGTGLAGFGGDGGQATAARVTAKDIAIDGAGNLFIAGGERIRKVGVNGIITTIAGTGASSYNGDGIPAINANINGPSSVRIDSQGSIFLSEGVNSYRIRKINTSGIISTFAGTGDYPFNGDNRPATQANIATPNGIALDSQGNLYVAERDSHRIRKVDTNGIITTIIGPGPSPGFYSSDGLSGPLSSLAYPEGVAVDRQGHIVINDSGSFRVRRLEKSTPGNVTLTLTSP